MDNSNKVEKIQEIILMNLVRIKIILKISGIVFMITFWQSFDLFQSRNWVRVKTRDYKQELDKESKEPYCLINIIYWVGESFSPMYVETHPGVQQGSERLV